jgi:hypothetical protein
MTKQLWTKIQDVMGQYTCNDFDEYPAILKALKAALIESPHQMVDYLEEITIWENVKYTFTVREFCDQLGIDENTDLSMPVDRTPKKMDFHKRRNKMVDKLNAFILEYKEFTKEVSPKNWRTTGTHCTQLDKICAEIQNLQPITEADKKIDWVRKSLEK